MSNAALVWIVIYCIAAMLFFGAAVVIGFFGAKDLKDLLSRSDRTR